MLILKDIIISPFSVVNFKRFFLADILTSSKLMLTDMIGTYCFFSQREFQSITPASTCSQTDILPYYIMVLPLWFRFWQCMKRYKDDRTNVTQLYNAFKYFWGIMAGLMTLMYKTNGGQFNSNNHFTFWFVLYLICQTIATIYSYVWDLYMDWGLCRYWDLP